MVEALVWVGVVFAAGSLLILERRCLGQMAIVQPLVVCLAAGWLIDEPEMAIWLGVTLQLFSVAKVRQVDWALTGIVAAVTLTCLQRLGTPIGIGGPQALLLTAVVVLVGFASKALDRRYARTDGERLRSSSPWVEKDPAWAIETSVRSVSVRWLLVGGLEVTLGAGLVVAAVMGMSAVCKLSWMTSLPIISAAVPILAGAVAVGSLVQYRFVLITAVAVAGCWAVLL